MYSHSSDNLIARAVANGVADRRHQASGFPPVMVAELDRSSEGSIDGSNVDGASNVEKRPESPGSRPKSHLVAL